jgi:DNA-binding CsgD family transcriptional regulator
MTKTNVFVSWSGERSRILAASLKDFLSDVIHHADVWMSAPDIEAGARWSIQLAQVLERCQVGVACVTPENQNSAWLLFEAGALSKAVQGGRLIPFLLDLEVTELRYPLAQFQTAIACRQGAWSVVESINSAGMERISSDRLLKHFERWWPDLEVAIQGARSSPTSAPPSLPRKSEQQLMHEVLEAVRSISMSGRLGRQEYLSIALDCRGFFSTDEAQVQRVYTSSDITIAAFLDMVWSVLNRFGEVPPYRYGDRWLLRNTRTNEIYRVTNEGAATHRRDYWALSTFGLIDGDVLEVVSVEASERERIRADLKPTGLTITELSEIEREMLRLIMKGLPMKTIARRLNLSGELVRAHMSALYKKLKATSRDELVLRAQQLDESGELKG